MYLFKLFFLIIVSILFIGCGNGSFDSTSSSSGTSVFSLMAVDDPIINAQVSASNCSGFTQDGNGTYSLTGCSKKPANIIISGGFIDLNGDSLQDINESKLSFPLILNTDQFPGSDNFVVTPLTTILSSLPSGTTLEDYATKLGLTKEDLFVDLHTKYGKNSVKHNILQEINLVFEQASKAGIGKNNPNDFISFLNDYAEIIHNADITDGNSTALLAKAKENFSKPENLAKYKNKYGTLVFTGFVVDTRDTKTFEEQIDDRNQKKSKLIFSGFIYDDFIPNAIVTLKDSKDLNVTLAQTTSDDLGYYNLEVDDNLIHEDSVLLFEASKDLNVSDVNSAFNNNIKLVSAIAVKEIKKSFDTEIGIADNKDITISNVTTAKYVIIKVLDTNNTIMKNPDKLIEAKLELENNSEKQEILLSVSAVIKTLIDGNAIIQANSNDNNNTLDYMTNELLVVGANETLDVNISSNDTITEEAVNEMETVIQDDEVLSEQLDSSTQAIEVYILDKSHFENRSFDLVFNDENSTKSTIIFYQNNVFKEIKNNKIVVGSWGLSNEQDKLVSIKSTTPKVS